MRTAAVVSPLGSWFPDALTMIGARRRLGRVPAVIPARDRAWRDLTPAFDDLVDLAKVGLPFQIAAERRYDRSGRLARLRPALRAGKTVFFPQIHQVLPRVMRLMVALRLAFLGPGREECSFLFLVDGAGREGLGLHHDGDVHAFWVQLAGRRTVTLGPPVTRGTPQELPDRRAHDALWETRALEPGSLLYLPPRTPHRVVCHERSLALSLTWSGARGRAPSAPQWDVASGHVPCPPPSSRTLVWTQVPTRVAATRTRARLTLPDGARVDAPPSLRRLAAALASMATFPREALGDALPTLEAHGVVGAQDLPLFVVPDRAAALDGWRFA